MDVGDPSNFARVLDLYGGSHAAISAEISGATYTDEQIAETDAGRCGRTDHYLLDPHGACGFRALAEGLKPGETGRILGNGPSGASSRIQWRRLSVKP
mgnify:CR=1 FL=1